MNAQAETNLHNLALVEGGVDISVAPEADDEGMPGVGLLIEAVDWTDASVVLDMADGVADGKPLLPPEIAPGEWLGLLQHGGQRVPAVGQRGVAAGAHHQQFVRAHAHAFEVLQCGRVGIGRQRVGREQHRRRQGHAADPGQASSVQQRRDDQGGNAEHGDLAQRVEGAEVDQHHVDHVRAPALGQRPLQEEG